MTILGRGAVDLRDIASVRIEACFLVADTGIDNRPFGRGGPGFLACT